MTFDDYFFAFAHFGGAAFGVMLIVGIAFQFADWMWGGE